MVDTIEVRVARGVAWLDGHYPAWWKAIDLGTLSVSSCHFCVLGQVYSGCIGIGEQDQILAQVLGRQAPWVRGAMREDIDNGSFGGFNALVEYHDILAFTSALGFAVRMHPYLDDYGVPMSVVEEFSLLTDEWTRAVISRRLSRPHEASEILVPVAVS